jgi:hypothetical protein
LEGGKLRAEIRENQLYPPSGWDGDNPLEDNLEAPDLAPPEGLERLLREGRARYMFIDNDDTSLLREILDILYSPDQVSVVRLGGNYPATFFVVGDQVPLNSTFAICATIPGRFSWESVNWVARAIRLF